MNIVDLLVTIVVVTILVTIVLAIVTYVAYKLRLSREPDRGDVLHGPQYFVPYPPPEAKEGRTVAQSETVRAAEGHASEA